MARKLAIVAFVFAMMMAGLFGAARAVDDTVSLPQVITPESACPVTGCASGMCHGYDDVPQPDGVHEMTCPETGCASVDCHAWGTLTGGYRQASDASLNLWVLFPIVLITVLVVFVKKAGRLP